MWKPFVCVAALICATAGAAAADQRTSPVGDWVTIDDDTGKPGALIEITEHRGVLSGRITKLFDPDEPNPICHKCEGSKHNQPLVGLELFWGLKKDGDEWTGGSVVDPETGNIYKLKLSLSDDGRKLDVRGYLGISLFGRTEQWLRSSSPAAQAAAGGSLPNS